MELVSWRYSPAAVYRQGANVVKFSGGPGAVLAVMTGSELLRTALRLL